MFETPAGKASTRETPQAQSAEGATGPHEESEYLEWKSTSICTGTKKTEGKPDFHRVCFQSEIPNEIQEG